MTRQLATLLGAGLPLVQSLTTLISQTSHPQLKTILAQIREEVNEGNSFSYTMTHYPQVFPAFYLNMVRAGEASGTLHLVLERLADFSEKQQALKGRVRAALAYPLFMFLDRQRRAVLPGHLRRAQRDEDLRRDAPDPAAHHDHPHRREPLPGNLLVGHRRGTHRRIRRPEVLPVEDTERPDPAGPDPAERSRSSAR